MKYFKLRKAIASLLIATSILSINPIGANAEWKSDNIGWWYTEGNSYATGWRQIDGKWYCFTLNGYMLHDITVNGCIFGSDGTWLNGHAKTQKISVAYPSNWIKSSLNGKEIYYIDDKGTCVNLDVSSMAGNSEENCIKVMELDLKAEFGIDNVYSGEKIYNNKKASVMHYFLTTNNKNAIIMHVTFFDNNMAYTFTLVGDKNISDETIKSLEDMLNTVELIN